MRFLLPVLAFAATAIAQNAGGAVCVVNHGTFYTNQFANVIFTDVPSTSPDFGDCMGGFLDNLRGECNNNIVDWGCTQIGDNDFLTFFMDGQSAFPGGWLLSVSELGVMSCEGEICDWGLFV